MTTSRIQDRAQGRWRSILPALGVHERFLSKNHGPCPICGGTDRYRWKDDKGTGDYFCNQCGSGNGVDLVMKVNGIDFLEAKRRIDAELPNSTLLIPKTDQREKFDPKELNERLWKESAKLDGTDPASRYLIGRGIRMEQWPNQLRYVMRASYSDGDGRSKVKSFMPAMVAKMVAPDAKSWTLHRTYLDLSGHKAKVAKVRKMMPGNVPEGGAVRLTNSAETMGVAEGIETALSAMLMFDIPVWATLSAGAMVKWKPPKAAKHIIIFGDVDDTWTGPYSVMALAYRLRRDGYSVEPRLPGWVIPDDGKVDWNDIRMSELGAAKEERHEVTA